MKNKISLRVSKDFYNFVLKFGANRVKADMELQTLSLCELPDIIVKYFKLNNDKYLDLVNMETNNGIK